MHTAFTRMIPPAVLRRVVDRPSFLCEVATYNAMDDSALLRATESCLRNLDRLDDRATIGPDGELQLVLVPELWERLRPGTRSALRRISSTLAEYDPDRPSIFARLLSTASRARLRQDAEALRERVACAARFDAAALVEQTRFAIAGSRVVDRWAPAAFVYGPGFVYRLVPAIAWRVLVRSRRQKRD